MEKRKEFDVKPLKATEGGDSFSQNVVRTTSAVSEAVLARPLEIKVGDNFERAFRIFRAMVQKERVVSRFKESRVYEKPSDKKSRKRSEARKSRLEESGIGKTRKERPPITRPCKSED